MRLPFPASLSSARVSNTMPNYKLGKLPARKGAVGFHFGNFFDLKKLPTPPKSFGHHKLIKQWFGFENDKYGNCVWAGAAHEHMLWSVEGGRQRTRFLTKTVLSDYSAVTGFNPNKPETDNGTDMTEAASYRRKVGVLDATGQRRKIDAYVALEPGNWDQVVIATYLMGAAGIGFLFPNGAMEAFDAGQPWDVPKGKVRTNGGHYVCSVGRAANGNLITVTWGREQEMTEAFYERFNDEAIAYVSLEILNERNLSPEGFDATALRKHLALLG